MISKMRTQNNYQSILDEVTPLNKNKEQENHEVSSSVAPWSLSLITSPKYLASVVGVCFGLILFLGVVIPEPATTQFRTSLRMMTSGANTIKICAKEMILVDEQDSENAFVECFDKDPNGDDMMAEGFTGKDGCATLTYDKQSWDGWTGGSSPDIYCTVNKVGFVESCPPDKDHHDQTQVADFGTVALYRDRSSDYGHDNGCGPHWSEFLGVNGLAAFATGFGEQCTHHDKCYWDCQIFLAEGGDATAAQEFCDNEMYEGMKSHCRVNQGDLPGLSEDVCLAAAKTIYEGLKALGSTMAYDKTTTNCPAENGKPDPSMKNDYSHDSNCYADGYGCGFDGSVSDDMEKCNKCCSESNYAIDKGNVWSDYYCKCFPRDLNIICGSTNVLNRFNKCDQCCHDVREDKGLTYSDYYCK